MGGRTAFARHLDALAADVLDAIWRYEAEHRPLTASEQRGLETLESRVAWLRALAAKHAADAVGA